MTSRPSAIMPPQLTRFGSESPRNASADSTRMAAPTVTPTSATTGWSAPGSTSRNAISSGCRPGHPGSIDVVAPAQGQDLGPHESRGRGPRRDRRWRATTLSVDGPEHAHDREREDERRDGLERLGHPHQHVVDAAAEEARRRADERCRCRGRRRRPRGRPSSETRAPWTSIDQMSRPNWSLPSG